jgi:hypothetical protein
MEYKSFMEALKGKQHNIDKNKNGKVDAHDFELLRKEETEELDEIHRMKTKLNKLDAVSNKSVARQKLSNLMKSGKARGALIANKMRTLNMGDDLDQEDLDALHEVLSKDAKAGDWISDFVHSTNPKFDGKSKKERINMALGAYYDTHKKKDGISEEAEQLDEVNQKTVDLAKEIAKKHKNMTSDVHRGNVHIYNKHDEEAVDRLVLAHTGKDKEGNDRFHLHRVHSSAEDSDHRNLTAAEVHAHAAKHIGNYNEEVEHIEEKSDQAKQNKTMKNMMDASRGARYKLNNPVPDAEPEHKTARAHNVAIGRALRSEDKMTTTKDKSGKLVSFKYEGDWKKSTEKKQGSGVAANLAGQAMQKMKKMSEEKDEKEYGYEGDMALNQLSTLIRCAEMIKDTLKPDTDLPEWVQSKITLASDYIVTAADYLHSELEEGYYEKPASAYRRKGDEVGGGSSKAVSVKVNHAGDEPHEEKWEPVKKIKKPVAEAVQKADIPAYLRKAKGDTPLKMDDLKRKDTLSDAENLKRNRGVKESFDDEGNLISNKVSYKEFMLEYTPGAGGVTQIKGRSYGANYSDPEGADDADDNKPMKPAAEKRGRGRPAGAKSGARKITGTSKLMNK